ncbi:LPS assembly lipoprotein LptE [Sphingomonas sp. ASV193]|uniref:LPS assembly lipoprotein LptE n=1 Tax=Sphingomonas sp. ASV193 TaxID=3144405 RepID=UPI0032E87FFC
MSRRLALLLCFALPGCGLHPLYAGGASAPVAVSLASIKVDPIPERGGWLVRNALVDRLGSEQGNAPAPRYRLRVELDDSITGFGIRGDRAATRERRALRARYRLVTVDRGETVLDATAVADAGIDVVSSPYATVAAEDSALERLSGEIADQIVARLGLYATRAGAAPAP